MCLSDSSSLETSSNAWLTAARIAIRAARHLIAKLPVGEIVRRDLLVMELIKMVNPEHLVRLCQKSANRSDKPRPNKLDLEAQVMSGARRALSCAIGDMKSNGIIEKIGRGESGSIRLLRIPQQRFHHRFDDEVRELVK